MRGIHGRRRKKRKRKNPIQPPSVRTHRGTWTGVTSHVQSVHVRTTVFFEDTVLREGLECAAKLRR